MQFCKELRSKFSNYGGNNRSTGVVATAAPNAYCANGAGLLNSSISKAVE